MASSVFLNPAGGTATLPDGTSGAPAIAFASEPTLGFFRSSAGVIGVTGNVTNTTAGFTAVTDMVAGAAGFLRFTTSTRLSAPTNGTLTLQNSAQSIGSQFKVDALPTLTSGGGSGPAAAITAGSTPLAGSITVGGTPGATNIVITFGGTAFPSAPTVVWGNSTTSTAVKATASTTQLTFTSSAFAASDVLSWVCISSK